MRLRRSHKGFTKHFKMPRGADFASRFAGAGHETPRQSAGFTLIELLVVISIIALLASIVLASLNSARAKARDARRIADLRQLQTAVEFYYDSNNIYPGPTSGVCNSGLNEHSDGWCRDTRNNNGVTPIDAWIPGLVPFMVSMPHNPQPYVAGSWPYHYCLGGNNLCAGVGVGTSQMYWFMVMLEGNPSLTCPTRTYIWYNGSTNACPGITGYNSGAYVIKNF